MLYLRAVHLSLSAHAHTSCHTFHPVTYMPCGILTSLYCSLNSILRASYRMDDGWGRGILIFFFLSAAATAYLLSFRKLSACVYVAAAVCRQTLRLCVRDLTVRATTLAYDVYHLSPTTYHLPSFSLGRPCIVLV